MTKKLTFEHDASDIFLPRIGGGALIESDIVWPKAPNNENLMLFSFLPSAFCRNHLNFPMSDETGLHIFLFYQKESDDYYDYLTDDPKKVASKVMLTKVSKSERNECSVALPPKEIIVVSDDDEDSEENPVSKIIGEPCWIQDPIEIEGHRCVLQINGSRLNKVFPNHKGIFLGGMGYLFLPQRDSLELGECGYFLIQYS